MSSFLPPGRKLSVTARGGTPRAAPGFPRPDPAPIIDGERARSFLSDSKSAHSDFRADGLSIQTTQAMEMHGKTSTRPTPSPLAVSLRGGPACCPGWSAWGSGAVRRRLGTQITLLPVCSHSPSRIHLTRPL